MHAYHSRVINWHLVNQRFLWWDILCGAYGWKPSPTKMDTIKEMTEERKSQMEVSRFLGLVPSTTFGSPMLTRDALVRAHKGKEEVEKECW